MKGLLFRFFWKVAWSAAIIGFLVTGVNEAVRSDGLIERLRERISEEVSKDELWADYHASSQEVSTTIPATSVVESYDDFRRVLH